MFLVGLTFWILFLNSLFLLFTPTLYITSTAVLLSKRSIFVQHSVWYVWNHNWCSILFYTLGQTEKFCHRKWKIMNKNQTSKKYKNELLKFIHTIIFWFNRSIFNSVWNYRKLPSFLFTERVMGFALGWFMTLPNTNMFGDNFFLW